MSTFTPSSDGPTTEAEFHDRLGSLIRTAYANSVDIEGGWAYRTTNDDYPDWGVEIYEVVKSNELHDPE